MSRKAWDEDERDADPFKSVAERSTKWTRTQAASPGSVVTKAREMAPRASLLVTLVIGILAAGSAGIRPF